MENRVMREWEIILVNASKTPERAREALLKLYPGMTLLEAQNILDLSPIRLEIIRSPADKIKSELEQAGAMMELKEVFDPFSVSETFFSNWLREHTDTREVYRFTYLPSFHPSATLWLWYSWNETLHASAQAGNQPYRLMNRVKPGSREEWIPSEEVWLRLVELIEAHQFWSSEKWPEHWGIDGATWHFEGYRNRQYHHRSSWSPDTGPAFEIGKFFFNLLPEDFGKIEIY
jgi:hypothetical protein